MFMYLVSRALGLRQGELHHQIRRGDKTCLDAGLCSLERSALAMWVLPTPEGPRNTMFSCALDEGEAAELHDLLARRAACEGKIVALERLDRRQRRELQHRLSGALLAAVALGDK